jgi:hypothetical protein
VRVQFLVTAFAQPEHLARLCARLGDVPGSDITVQWDCEAPSPRLASPVEVVPTRAPVAWGDGTQLSALLDSLTRLRDRSFDWLLLLSGSDYPIRPPGDLARYLDRARTSMFLEIEGDGIVSPPSGRGPGDELQRRYFYRHHPVPARIWRAIGPSAQRVLAGGLTRVTRPFWGNAWVQVRPRGLSPTVAVRSRNAPFSSGQPCRKGRDWWAISRPVFDDLIEHTIADDALVRYYRRTYIPVESYFHTVLVPRWGHLNARHNLHYRKFTVGSHPDVLTEHDLDDMRASGRFFARKFDGSPAVLDRIDDELLR